MDCLGSDICIVEKVSASRSCSTATRKEGIQCTYSVARGIITTKPVLQILQFLSWLSRMIITLLVSMSLQKPSWDLLHIHLHSSSDSELSSPYSSRVQWSFRLLFTLELAVSNNISTNHTTQTFNLPFRSSHALYSSSA